MSRLTQARLKSLLNYCHETGDFTWAVDHGKRIKAGQSAGCRTAEGRILIGIDGRLYRAHRLAFLWMTGHWPGPEVDHKDHDQTNNAWSNLRSGDRAFNQQNMIRPQRNNKTGFLGVTHQAGRWFAKIYAGGKKVSLGGYADPESAHAAYVEAKRRLHQGGIL